MSDGRRDDENGEKVESDENRGTFQRKTDPERVKQIEREKAQGQQDD